MAFGKDTENKKRLPRHGGSPAQRAAQRASGNRPQRPRGGSNIPYWSGAFRPTTGNTPDTIRIIKAPSALVVPDDDALEALYAGTLPEGAPVEYSITQDYFEYVEHYHGGIKSGAICSAGPHRMDPKLRNVCHGCDMFWEDYSERKEKAEQLGVKRVDDPNRISMSSKTVLLVLALGTFYKADRVNYDGNVRLNPKSGKPYYDWKKLEYANDPAAAGKETKVGHLMPWSLGNQHWEALRTYGDVIRNSCAGCGTQGTIKRPALRSVQFVCSNEDCVMPAIDMETTSMSPDQVAEIVNAPHRCEHCSEVGFLDEMLHCDTCASNGTSPARAWIFDVDMDVQRTTSDSTTSLVVTAYGAPVPLDDKYNEALVHKIDLPRRFAPTPVEKQVEIWKL